jgi:hypothetical protein
VDGDVVEQPDDSPDNDPEIEMAIRQQQASFTQWASAWFYSRARFNPSSTKARERWQRYRDGGLFDSFVASEGRVVDSYYCGEVDAAAALTLKRRSLWSKVFRWEEPTLHILNNAPPGADGDPDAVAALDLLSECDELSVRAADFLPNLPRRQILSHIYGLTTDALFILDEAARRLLARPAPSPGTQGGSDSGLVQNAKARLRFLTTYLDWAAKRAAQFYYLRGVALGLALVALVAVLLGQIEASGLQMDLLAWTMGAGAAGATVSVLLRVRSSGLVLDYQVGRRRLLLLGAVRPVIGAVSGSLVYFLSLAGIIPLAESSAYSRQLGLHVIFGFLSGYSERWIQDMLANVGERLQLSQEEPISETIEASSEEQQEQSTSE